MKCPKCGFVSYAGLDQCKKCGYPFVKAAPKESAPLLTTLFAQGAPSGSRPTAGALPAPNEKSSRNVPQQPTERITPGEATPARGTSTPADGPAARGQPGDRPAADWRDELSERVVNFRKRRARFQPGAEPAGNLELDFDDLRKPEDILPAFHAPQDLEDGDSGLDMEIREPLLPQEEDGGLHAPVAVEEPEGMQLDAGPGESDEMSLGEPAAENSPMEILVGSPNERGAGEQTAPMAIIIAPLGRRFMAGMLDALVLLLGAALFGGIFWYSMTQFCGHNSLVPFNLAILGLVALVFIFAYFAAFTAIAYATPGLLYQGCEIRNLQGEHPTKRESFWRAFGVLVSLAALMVGFIWAYVDSDSLTWHDRMSGTVISEEPAVAGTAALKSKA